MRTVTPIAFPSKGLHQEVDPIAIPQNSYAMGVNVRLEQQSLEQRHGWRELPLVSGTEGLVDEFQLLNLQGAIPYTPSEGQSALQFASKGEFIAVAAAGRKFTLEVIGQGPKACARLEEITGGLQQPADLHQMWLSQAENYLISGDDYSTTWIYDSVNPAYGSTGYISTEPGRVNSTVPNRIRLPHYTNSRLGTVQGERGIDIGDIIHGSNLTNASDLIKFTEQTYWAEGQRFVLPSNVGPILAAYNLPTLGDNNDHGDAIYEASRGVYAISTEVYPRTAWADTRMVRLVSQEGGARGQFAFDTYNNDAIRRTLRGLETLSFNKRAGDVIKDPQQLLSEPIDFFLQKDYRPHLRFNSTKMHREVKRLYTTVRPWLCGAHWQHKGVMSFNYKHKVWEGLHTGPPQLKDIKIIVPMHLSGDERLFQLCGGNGKTIRLVEVEPGLRCDVLDDGTQVPIESQVRTRMLYENLTKSVELDVAKLQFSNITGNVSYELFSKSTRKQGAWAPWQEGKFCQNSYSHPGTKQVAVSQFPGDPDTEFSFLIKWTGKAALRFMSLKLNDFDEPFEDEVEDSTACPPCSEDLYSCSEHLFSYSSE